MEEELLKSVKEMRVQIKLVRGKIKTYRPDMLTKLDDKIWAERTQELRRSFEECEEKVVRCIEDLNGDKCEPQIDDLQEKLEDLRIFLTGNEKAVKERMQCILEKPDYSNDSSNPENTLQHRNTGVPRNKQNIFINERETLEFVKSGTGKSAKYTCLRLTCHAASKAGQNGVNRNSFKIHCLKKHDLKIDIRNRTGKSVNNPRFDCEICEKKLSRQNNLTKHYQEQHRIEMISTDDAGGTHFTCLDCDEQLTSNEDLATHPKDCMGDIKKVKQRKKGISKGKKSVPKKTLNPNTDDIPEVNSLPENMMISSSSPDSEPKSSGSGSGSGSGLGSGDRMLSNTNGVENDPDDQSMLNTTPASQAADQVLKEVRSSSAFTLQTPPPEDVSSSKTSDSQPMDLTQQLSQNKPVGDHMSGSHTFSGSLGIVGQTPSDHPHTSEPPMPNIQQTTPQLPTQDYNSIIGPRPPFHQTIKIQKRKKGISKENKSVPKKTLNTNTDEIPEVNSLPENMMSSSSPPDSEPKSSGSGSGSGSGDRMLSNTKGDENDPEDHAMLNTPPASQAADPVLKEVRSSSAYTLQTPPHEDVSSSKTSNSQPMDLTQQLSQNKPVGDHTSGSHTFSGSLGIAGQTPSDHPHTYEPLMPNTQQTTPQLHTQDYNSIIGQRPPFHQTIGDPISGAIIFSDSMEKAGQTTYNQPNNSEAPIQNTQQTTPNLSQPFVSRPVIPPGPIQYQQMTTTASTSWGLPTHDYNSTTPGLWWSPSPHTMSQPAGPPEILQFASSGESGVKQGTRMGLFFLVEGASHNGRPVWEMDTNRFKLFYTEDGYWMIGTPEDNVGGISTAETGLVPPPVSGWEYVHGGEWIPDQHLKVQAGPPTFPAKIRVTSTGPAKDEHPYTMGEYVKTTRLSNSRPVYRNQENDEVFLFYSGRGHWLINDDTSVPEGWISSKYVGKILPPNQEWEYAVDAVTWAQDDSLVFTVIN